MQRILPPNNIRVISARSSTDQALRAYWQGLVLPVEPLNLPTDFARPAEWCVDGATLMFPIETDLWHALEGFCQQEQVSLHACLLANLGVLLARYSGQHHLCIGMQGTNGLQEEFTDARYPLILVAHSTPEANFRELLEDMEREVTEAWNHQGSSPQALRECLKLEERSNRHWGYDVAFSLLEEVSDPSGSPQPVSKETTECDLDLAVVRTETQVFLQVTYATALFKKQRIQRMGQHFLKLLVQAISTPELAVKDFDYLTEQERQVIAAANDTSHPPKLSTAALLFEDQVMRTPEAPAIAGEQPLSYAQLNREANQLADFLRDEGVGPNTYIAIWGDKCAEMAVAILAAFKAGGAFVPVNPDWAPLQRQDVLSRLKPLVCFVFDREGTYKGRDQLLKACGVPAMMLHRQGPELVVQTARRQEPLCTRPTHNPVPMARAEDLAYTMFTSGTTGQPKGILTLQRNLVNLAFYLKRRVYKPGDRVLQMAPYYFDGSVMDTLGGLLSGATLYFVPGIEVPIIQAAFRAFKPTHMLLTPTLLSALVPCLEGDDTGAEDLCCIATGGERLDVELPRKIWSTLGPQVQFINVYGPTETTVLSTTCFLEEEMLATQGTVSIGHPIDNTRIQILDEALAVCGLGIPGEICIAGDGVAAGYFNDPHRTARSFVSHADGERYYRSGDLGFWGEDGRLHILGRIDKQVKVRGYRIELEEIEGALKLLPAIEEAAVLAIGDANNKRLCAYFVPTEAKNSPDAASLKEALAESLPKYMIPTQFMRISALPYKLSGKLDEAALPQPGEESDAPLEGPDNEVEALLMSLWKEVLGVEGLGRHSNFFELGGDSMKGITLSARLLKHGLKLDLSKLFASPTIAELATQIHGVVQSWSQEPVSGPVPLTAIQHWFFEAFSEERDYFNQAMMFHHDGLLNPQWLEEALAHLVRHHDALRMVFEVEAGQVRQTNRLPEEHHTLFEHHTSLQDHPTQDEMKPLVIALQQQARMNHSMVCGLLVVGQKSSRLFLAIHHLVVDNISWGTIAEDLGDAYQQVMAGEEVCFPLKTASFQLWSQKCEAYAQQQALQEQFNHHWQQVEAVEMSLLPDDGVLEPQPIAARNFATLDLSPAQTQTLICALNLLPNGEINHLLLWALTRAMRNWRGIEATKLFLEGHGREDFVDVDVTRTVGWFTALFPVVLRCEDQMPLQRQLQEIGRQLADIPDKGVGYGIYRYLSGKGTHTGKHDPQILFNYLGDFDKFGNDAQAFFKTEQVDVNWCISPDARFPYALEIHCGLMGGGFHFSLSYPHAYFEKEVMQELVDHYGGALMQIIEWAEAEPAPTLEDPFEAEQRRYQEQVAAFQFDRNAGANYQHILVTGTTGFLGAHMVPELLAQSDARLHLLVRAQDADGARTRLLEKLSFYFGEEDAQGMLARCDVVCGDFALDQFGLPDKQWQALAGKVDSILHVGALTKQYGPYETFYAVNVAGTQRLLDFAQMQRPKHMHYVSTCSVGSGIVNGRPQSLFTEYDCDRNQQLEEMVYVKSKLEAEKAVIAARAQGVQTSIYRVGNLVGSSRTGIFQENIGDDYFYANLKAMVTLNFVVEMGEQLAADFSFVDCAAKALTHLMLCDDLMDHTWHMMNTHPLKSGDVFDLFTQLGQEMRLCQPGELNDYLTPFLEQEKHKAVVERFILHSGMLRSEQEVSETIFGCDKTTRALAALGFQWPKPTAQHLATLLAYTRRIGFIEPN